MDGVYVVPGALEMTPEDMPDFHNGETYGGVQFSMEGISDDYDVEHEIEKIVECLSLLQSFTGINIGVHVNSATATRPVPHIGYRGCGCSE